MKDIKRLENDGPYLIIDDGKEMFCPFCEEHHSVHLVERAEKFDVCGKTISVNTRAYFCPITDEVFNDGELIDDNLMKIRSKITQYIFNVFNPQSKFLLRIYVDDVLNYEKDCVSVLEAEKEFEKYKFQLNPCGFVTYKIYSLIPLEEGE